MASLFRRNINFLICDMAGTVINENGIIYNSLEKVLKNIGCVITSDMKESWYGKEKRRVLIDTIYDMNIDYSQEPNLKYLFAKAERELETELNKNYFENGEIELIDSSLLDFFANLRINGVKIALNTGYNSRLQKRIIEEVGLKGCIDDYISSDMCRYGRPYPYMIHNLMERNNIYDVRNVAKVGDTINDMWEGRNAGVGLRIGVLSGAETRANLFPHADVIVNKVTDLKDDDLPVFLL
tara:strand:- start:635 stop:1351 length:717 start_codon:yes stop_codon:yes gene_type:complete